jgi:hypothetical protein
LAPESPYKSIRRVNGLTKLREWMISIQSMKELTFMESQHLKFVVSRTDRDDSSIVLTSFEISYVLIPKSPITCSIQTVVP